MRCYHSLLTDTTTYYPPAAAGRYRIKAKLHVPEANSSPGISIELSFKPEPFRRAFMRSKVWAYLHSLGRRDEEKNPPLTENEKKRWERARPRLVFGTMEQLLPDQLLAQWGRAIVRMLHDHASALTDPQFT